MRQEGFLLSLQEEEGHKLEHPLEEQGRLLRLTPGDHASRRWSNRRLVGGGAVASLLACLALVCLAAPWRSYAGRRPSADLAKSEELETQLLDGDYPSPPSLFCFSVILANSNEELLVRAQFQHRASIWACEEAAVLANKKVSLGYSDNDEVWTWETPFVANVTKRQRGKDTDWSYYNADVFLQAWDAIIKSGHLWKHDWTVKVDADTVYFPDRLRLRLVPYKDQNVYFANCNNDEFRVAEPTGPKLFGALEVFSKKAMHTYASGKTRCYKNNNGTMSEDFYMQMCMDMLNVTSKFDENLVSDSHCYASTCDDWTRVSFHPYRDIQSYFSCYGEGASR